MAGPDYILDLAGGGGEKLPDGKGASDSNAAEHAKDDHAMLGRPWIAVHWRCCGVYSRIYRNRSGDAYEGRCPKCAAPVCARIGPEGTLNRFFEAN